MRGEDGFLLKTADMVENNGLEGTRFGTTCGQISVQWI